jgi:hypothetical protein
MIRVDFDQPAYLRASKGLAILSPRLQHLLPADDEVVEPQTAAEPVIINRLYNGAKKVLGEPQVMPDEIKGELIPYARDDEDEPLQSENGVELNFGGIKGKSATGVYGGSGYAHYRFNKKNGKSFFVRVGKHLIWGIELAPELRRSGAVKGQTISVKFMGKEPVKVLKPVIKDGKQDSDWFDTHKNLWEVKVVQ